MIVVYEMQKMLSALAAAGRRQDGRPTTKDLKQATGLASGLVSVNYVPARTTATMEKIANVVARFHHLDESSLIAWMEGAPDRFLDQYWDQQNSLIRCTGPGPHAVSSATALGGWFGDAETLPPGWFDLTVDEDKVQQKQRQCHRCNRARQTPGLPGWEQYIDSSIDRAPIELRRAWKQVRLSGTAVTYQALALEAGMDVNDFRRVWASAGLPEKPRKGRRNFDRYMPLFLIALGAALSGTAWASADNIYSRISRRRRWASSDLTPKQFADRLTELITEVGRRLEALEFSGALIQLVIPLLLVDVAARLAQEYDDKGQPVKPAQPPRKPALATTRPRSTRAGQVPDTRSKTTVESAGSLSGSLLRYSGGYEAGACA